MIFLISSERVLMSYPPTVPSPPVGMRRPQSMRMVVDLPAPFGPRNPKISPFFTSRLMRSTATKSPNVRVRSLMLTALFPSSGFMYRASPIRSQRSCPLLDHGDEHILKGRQYLPVVLDRDALPGEYTQHGSSILVS